jgi:hypothetical protein
MRRTMWSVAAVGTVLALGAGATLATGEGGRHAGSQHDSSADQGNAKGKKARGLFALLLGGNELSGDPLRRGAGDSDGRGSANVTIDGTSVCFGISVTNIATPIAAHIHRGKRSENGPIVVSLVHPATGDPGASSGCTTATADLAEAIQRRPHRYYVNVHTGDFPAGAVRGQLFGKRR